MVRGRENFQHKSAGTTSNKTGSIFLHQREKSESHTPPDRKQGNLVLPFENRRNKERTYDQIEQRDLSLSSISKYVYHSRILSAVLNTVVNRDSRKNQAIQSAFSSQSFSSSLLTTRFSNNRSNCFPICHQLPQYIARHTDPYSQGTDGMMQNWNIGLPYAFPPFSMISRMLLKIKREYVPLLILIAPVWSTQPWYPELLNLCVREPVLLPLEKEILISPKNIVRPLMVENSLTLAARLVS